MSNQGHIKLEIPLWLTSKKFRPPEYGKLVEEVKRPDGLMCTEKVCTLLMSTGLRREFLGYVWSTANRHTPGVLNEQEFCIILALVAIAQKGTPVFDLSFLSRLSEPPIPVFDRKFTLKPENSHSRYPSSVNTNQGFFSNDTRGNNTTLGQSKNNEDEYSDFQSAVLPANISKSIPNTGHINSGPSLGKQLNHNSNPGNQAPSFISSNVERLTFDSPVHAIANFTKCNPPANSSQVLKSKSESSVGSRLANYDLGLSSSSSVIQPTVIQPTAIQPTTIQPTVTQQWNSAAKTNDSLLIGEVDRYSALRDLVATDEPSTSESIMSLPNGNANVDFNHPPTNMPVKNNVPNANDDVLQIVIKSQPADVSTDFGDFQSFSNPNVSDTFESLTEFKNENSNNAFGDVPAMSKYHDFATLEKHSSRAPDLTSSVYISMLTERRNSLSDGEFGDFVSCTNDVIKTPDVPEPVISKPTTSTNIYCNSTKFGGPIQSKSQTYQPVPKINFNVSSTTKPDSNFQRLPRSDRISPKNSIATFHSTMLKNSDIDLLSSPEFNFNANDDVGFHIENDFGIADTNLNMMGPLKTTSIESREYFDNENLHINIDAINTQDFDCVHPIRGKFSETSPETRSLASLDLGNYNTTWELSDTTKPSIEANVGLHADSKSLKNDINYPNLSPSSPSLNLKYAHGTTETCTDPQQSIDRYHCFKEEIENETERYSYEWIRCMQCCYKIITYAMNVFNSASSSTVIRDVVCNEKGQSYILNLIEVYLVASRIQRSWLKLGGDSKVGQIHHEIVESWDSLTPFLLGTPLMEDISMADEWLEGEYSDYSKVCGVCLINTKKDDPNALLDYGGKHYHATCANLWINGVDSILPSLSYVSLL